MQPALRYPAGRYRPEALPDLNARAERERLSPPALKAFFNIMARWQKPGDITDMPRMSYDCTSGANLISSRFIEDGSYLRVGEVTLGLRLPNKWASKVGMDNAKISFSGRNLKTFTKYSGYNPDVNSSGSDNNVVAGTDYYAYPLARTFTFGISGGW